MKKLLVTAAFFVVISACSTESEAPAAPVEAVVEGPVMEDYVGEWNVTTADGSTHVTTNNADGTFSRVMADGAEDSGGWTLTDGQGCWTVEGEAETCYTISEEDITGKVTLTTSDGATTTARRIVVDPTAPADGAAVPEAESDAT